ncbi:MAG: type IV pili methyl-accepting chemotaxis transducer N-terminal domain-containing protein [Gammaproteobacteria bacterium]
MNTLANHYRFRCIVWALLMLCGSQVHCQPAEAVASTNAIADSATAVDFAGRQRMLAQRMTKAYLMLVRNIAPERAQSILEESRRRFEVQLEALKNFNSNPAIHDAVVHLETSWNAFKAVLDQPPNDSGAEKLYDLSEQLQKAAHNTTLACERISGTPLDHLINLAGRQRMLTQRIAKFYLYRTAGRLEAPAEMEFHLSRAHFTAVLLQLEASPYLSDAVKARVAALRTNEWADYEAAILADKTLEGMLARAEQVTDLSERTLARTEEIVAMIVQDAKSSDAKPN